MPFISDSNDNDTINEFIKASQPEREKAILTEEEAILVNPLTYENTEILDILRQWKSTKNYLSQSFVEEIQQKVLNIAISAPQRNEGPSTTLKNTTVTPTTQKQPPLMIGWH